MKVYLNLKLQDGEWIFDQEDWQGPIALAGGGGTEVTNQTVPTGPYGPQIPFIMQLFNEASRLYNEGPPQAFSGPLTPNTNPNIANTQGAVGGLAGGAIDTNNLIQQILLGQGTSTNPSADLGSQLTPSITEGVNAQINPTQAPGIGDATTSLLAGGGGPNPYLDQLVQAATQTQTDQFNRGVLPGIRSEAQQAGQVGGTRQGIAEGIAANDLTRSIGDTTSRIYGNAFDTQQQLQSQTVGQILDSIGTGTAQAGNLFQGGNALQLQQVLQSLGAIPGFQGQNLAQLGAVNQLGLQQYGLDQNAIDAAQNQYYYNTNSPFNLLSQYQQYVTGPYGSTVGNQSPTGYRPPNQLNP